VSDSYVSEPARQTPIIAEADVLVVGAGPAGIGAAVGAARAGAQTLLIERHGCVGGMLTAGHVLNIRQFNDGERVIIDGVGGELARRIHEAGGTEQTIDHGRYVRHDPELTKLVAQEMLLEAKVRLLLHAWLAEALVEDGAVRGAIVETKSGRGAVRAGCVVDATGDGDVIARSGAAFEHAGGDVQPMTLAAMLGGVDAWPDVKPPELGQKVRAAIEDGTFPIERAGLGVFPFLRPGMVYANATRIPGDATDAWELTRGEIEGRRQIHALAAWLRANAPGYERCYVQTTAPQVGLRETRRLVGLYTLTRDDVLGYRRFDDEVALNAYGIDIHYNDARGEMTWLEQGQCHGIPYRCLVPAQMDGLLAAGRCISADHEALGAVRVMATGLATGHAAGVAAALAARAGRRPRDVDVQDVRATLREQKAAL